MVSPPPTDDLWTFSVIVPAPTEELSNDTETTAAPATAKPKVVQLQRAFDDDDPRKATAGMTSTPVPAAVVGNLQEATLPMAAAEAEAEAAPGGPSDERTFLLNSGDESPTTTSPLPPPLPPQTKSAAATVAAVVTPLNPTGWTFSSPFWTIQSSILLKMTYKPAWQVLPSFTNNQCSRNDTAKSMVGAAASTATAAVCCCCSCCKGTDPYYSITFTTSDIDRVESISRLDIRGVGECSGIRLHLNYPDEAFRLVVPINVPQEYQGGWKEQMNHARHNQQEDNFLQTIKRDVDLDFAMGDSLSPTLSSSSSSSGNKGAGPTITFAMPKDTAHDDDEPPLLWRVEVPPPAGGPIALETLTILDGPLLSQSPTARTRQKPTHMFINGFQSWSFTGSVPIGQPQPQPAMPALFSKAFNHGGTVPPASLEYLPPPPSSSSFNSNHRRPPTSAPPESPYLSDFFTCITSHQEEEEEIEYADNDDTAVGGGDENTNNNDDTQGPHRNKLRGFRRKVIHRPLDERGGPALVLGWLSQRCQFGVISVDKELQRLQMHSSHQGQLLLPENKAHGMVRTDWAYCQLESPHTYDEEPLVHYLRAVAGYNQAKPLQNGPLLTGWCSWYHYYENISEESLRSNFSKLSKLRKTCPMNVSVVDDGYMTAWGDWNSLKPNTFSSKDSMKSVADNIRDEKMRPGIWLAPFTCDKHSKLVREHPDWIIRNHRGIPANSSNCGKFFYGLDATNPQVLEYVYNCIRRAVEEWGYTVLKIDFLYAACLDGNGKYDLSLSRAQAMHLAMHTIRSAAGPDTFLIGCGCPLGSGIGYVDGMRISADTGPTWYPAFPLPSWDHGTLPSVRGMIRNSITRAPLGHRWWHNDPDCLMLGSTTRLTLEEVASSASIVALTCGMLLLSDDLTKVSPPRMRILTKIFPMTGVSAVVLDLHALEDGHGLPTMLRLWCTDASQKREEFRKNTVKSGSIDDDRDHNEEAGFFSGFAAFRLSSIPVHPNERHRSCIHMVKGLGTWTVLSLSNWLDRAAVVHIPPMALAPPPEASAATSLRKPINPEHGYHVLAFWSSKYSWISGTPEYPDAGDETTKNNDTGLPTNSGYSPGRPPLVSKLLGPHETEIFHIKPVTPDNPQYLGSDIHFSCGQEVDVFNAEKNRLAIQLRTEYHRIGHIFIFVPIVNTSHVKTTCGGEPCRWTVVGNTPQNADSRGRSIVLGRVLQIAVASHADGRDLDGKVVVEF